MLPGSPPETLLVRPLGWRDDETALLLPDLDRPTAASFAAPTVDDRGDAMRARLLRDALRLSFRDTTGPFRSFATLAVSPRSYQLVPLMMATAQDTTRLLIADGVGIGKTVEAGLIAAELLASGDASRLAVLCSPQLAPQWQSELRTKFGIRAELLLPATANRLGKQVPFGQTIYDHHPHLIISTDYIKQRSRRDEFALHCPDLVIVDEAHTCIAPSTSTGASKAHQRYTLLRTLADGPERHLLLLTATPHNGDDGAWQSLVGLLDDRLGELPADLSGPEREDDRKLLARYLVQRQRADIRDFPTGGGAAEDTPFPTRERAEESYSLTPEYRKLFDRVLAFAKEHVADEGLSSVRQRVRWWSAIALLRSLASSPAAAEQTLRNRSGLEVDSVADADAIAAPLVFDVEAEDVGEDDDAGLGADTTTDPEANTRRRLQGFAREAAALKGVAGDAKLKRLITMCKSLLEDGFHPIVFCRYIPTAEYLQEHLTKALSRKACVDSVTGALPPEERDARVAALTTHDGPRLLIATDCLSEGVNLQEGFTAVLHYDLAWNPTRHEQREGRVDRFGQRAPTVRAVTYYGADNRIDGVVLDVLIRRHENIRRSTGVSVPVPADSATVMNAIWESLLLRGTEPEQMTLDLGGTLTGDIGDAVLTRWEDAAEREKASRSRFRQAGLRPDDVAAVLAAAQRSLGGPADAERFAREVLTTLSGQLAATDDGFSTTTDTLPLALTDALPPHRGARLRFHRQPPAPAGEPLLSRTDPAIEAIARYALDAALDPLARPEDRPARRAGVMRTEAVTAVTTLLVVRYRIEMVIPGARRTVTHVAEDAQFVAVRASGDELTVLDDELAESLLTAAPSGNVHDDLARRQVEKALARIPALHDDLVTRGEQVAADAVISHRVVRQSSRVAVRGLTARLLPPPDVLGVYVYLPGGVS